MEIDVHPVFDQMPTGPFDDPGGNRESLRQGLVVLQALLVVVDVVCGFVCRFALALAELLAGGGAAKAGGGRCGSTAGAYGG